MRTRSYFRGAMQRQQQGRVKFSIVTEKSMDTALNMPTMTEFQVCLQHFKIKSWILMVRSAHCLVGLPMGSLALLIAVTYVAASAARSGRLPTRTASLVRRHLCGGTPTFDVRVVSHRGRERSRHGCRCVFARRRHRLGILTQQREDVASDQRAVNFAMKPRQHSGSGLRIAVPHELIPSYAKQLSERVADELGQQHGKGHFFRSPS